MVRDFCEIVSETLSRLMSFSWKAALQYNYRWEFFKWLDLLFGESFPFKFDWWSFEFLFQCKAWLIKILQTNVNNANRNPFSLKNLSWDRLNYQIKQEYSSNLPNEPIKTPYNSKKFSVNQNYQPIQLTIQSQVILTRSLRNTAH